MKLFVFACKAILFERFGLVVVRDGPRRRGSASAILPVSRETPVDLKLPDARNFRSANSPNETMELGFGKSRPLIL